MLKRIPIVLLLLVSTLHARGGKVTWESYRWKVIHSEHFDIHYPEGYERLGQVALRYAEEANLSIGERLNHNLKEVIPVYIYPSHGDFQSTNITYFQLDEGVGGFTEPVKKRVVIPFMGAYDEFRHVITHELVHAFQFDILLTTSAGSYLGAPPSNRAPLWLVEGMAEYLSLGWDPTAEMVMRDALLNGWTPSLIDMTYGRVASGYMYYKGGQAAVRFLAENFGEHKLGELLRDVRDQSSFDDAIKTNFGMSLEDLDRKWLLWIKRMFYDYIDNNAVEEETRVLTRHFEDKSYLNLHPALSPDGKKIVYITIRNYDEVIVIRNATAKKPEPDYSVRKDSLWEKESPKESPQEQILLRAGNNAKVYQLHLLDNRITFTPDSQNIFFCARNQGKDVLYLFNIKKKKIIKKWVPQADMIQYPALSPDGQKAVFSATVNGKPDLYLLDLKSSKITKLTDDYFAEKEPRLSEDNQSVVYSGNANDQFENPDYDIFLLNLQTKESKKIISLPGMQENPKFTGSQSQKVVFISNHTGVPNAYVYNRFDESVEELTNIQGGITNADLDREGKKIIFSLYQNLGYDIGIRQENVAEKEYPEMDSRLMSFPNMVYPHYSKDLNLFEVENYKPVFSPDFVFFGLQWSSYSQLGGFLYASFSEYMGDHRVEIYADYFNQLVAPNLNLEYAYLKHRIDIYAGIFQSNNYFSILNYLDLTTINDFLYNPYFYTQALRQYGGYVSASYPISPFLKFNLGVEASHYVEKFFENVPEAYQRANIDTNLFNLQAALIYNNVLYSYFGPLKGWHLGLSVEQTVNVTGSDYVFNRVYGDLRKYFLFFERYVFTFRLLSGVITGPQKNFFPWQIGGYNTIRGYPYIGFQGDKFFVSNLELRFPLLDYLIFGFPAPWVMRGFSGVAFIDMGSTFSDPTRWKAINSKTGALQDLKMSLGLGARMILIPGIMLKIDWASPWNLQTIKPISKWEGRFSIGYEF